MPTIAPQGENGASIAVSNLRPSNYFAILHPMALSSLPLLKPPTLPLPPNSSGLALPTTMRPGNALTLLLVISYALVALASPLSVPDFRPFHPSRPLPPIDPKIIPFCNKADHPAICINSARYYSNEFPSVDSTNMFNIMIRALKDRLRFISAKADAMSNSDKLSEVERALVKECGLMYAYAFDDMTAAMVAFATRDMGTTEAKLNLVISRFKTCDASFKQNPNPLLRDDERLMKMASNSISIGKLSF